MRIAAIVAIAIEHAQASVSMLPDDEAGGAFTLHLLDSAQSHPIQSWHFENRVSVKIGRAEDCHIQLADPQISRVHVELVYREGQWTLLSLGRNGTKIDGAKVTEVGLADRDIFELASGSLAFQFVTGKDGDACRGTIHNVNAPLDFLEIDEEWKAKEVQKIAEGEAFRRLQQQVNRLKRGNSDVTQTDL